MLLLLAIISGGALAYFYFTAPARPVLDPNTLCPVDGPQGITVVLVDTSDDLPETTRREVLGELDDMIADVKRGIYIEGHGSFSIDQKRYNFQFGGDAFWLIENGKRTHMLRDVIYTGITHIAMQDHPCSPQKDGQSNL